MDYKDFVKSAAHVVPSARQLQWYDMEFYAFVHFTVNTYTDLEWGLGNEPESIFNPTELDCDQWVEAVKSAGMKGIILTAKHHDGFCLWQTKTTEHCVRNSPWKNGQGDVVKECAEACRRGGIGFGVYLSPWDRNASCYGTDEYNDFYAAQLTELLTGYGDLFMVWFDGACGEGPNGKRQVYDFPRYNALIRQYQPDAFIFSDFGPDLRWCGNEAGKARRSEWSVVPHDFCSRAEKQGPAGPLMTGSLAYMYGSDESIGELDVLQYAHGLAFCGSEVDMSIRPGWFYHEKEQPHSLERLMQTYLNSCGNNATFNLNIPPMPNGRFHEADIARLKEFGEALEAAFGEAKKVPFTVREIPMEGETQRRIRLTLPEKTKIAYVELRENIAEGQRVERFRILNAVNEEKMFNGYSYDQLYNGYTIGHRKICPVKAETDAVEIQILSARDTVELKDIIIYKA
ncbi:MAG: alpha-L-fucosidase [Clostridia bacterium]|nr:alpha-L-fucosidase [Clostridia bacterium]